MSYAAGRLRHRVVLQEYGYVLDSNGEPIQDPASGAVEKQWQDIAEVWASVEDISGRELIAAQAVESDITTRITIRHRAVNAGNRILFEGMFYNIRAVLADKESRREYITLMCTNGANEG